MLIPTDPRKLKFSSGQLPTAYSILTFTSEVIGRDTQQRM